MPILSISTLLGVTLAKKAEKREQENRAISALFKVTSVEGTEKQEHERRASEAADFLGTNETEIHPKETFKGKTVDTCQAFIDRVCNDVVRMRENKVARQTRWKVPTELDGSKNKILGQCRKKCQGATFALERVGNLSYIMVVM